MSNVLTDFEPATPEEVRNVIRKARAESCKLDPIQMWLLKQCRDELMPLVIANINRSMEIGSMRMCYKRYIEE